MTSERLRIRAARADDAPTVFDWRNDPTTRRMSVSTDTLSLDEHLRWFAARLASTECRMFIGIDDREVPVGVVRFDITERSTARVSIHVAPTARGRGVGSALLRLGIIAFLDAEPSVQTLEAVIRSDNPASERIFSANGFSSRRPADTPGFFMLTFARLDAAHLSQSPE